MGAMEDMSILAGVWPGRAKVDKTPKLGYMATFPIPEALCLGSHLHAGGQEDLPRVHDGRALDQHLA